MTERTDDLTRTLLTRRRIANIDDIIDHISDFYGSAGLIAAYFRQPKSVQISRVGDTESNFLYFNYISFRIQDGVVTRYLDRHEALEDVERLSDRVDCYVEEVENILFIYSGISEIEAEAIINLLIGFYMASDVYEHYISRTARLLLRNIDHAPYSLDEICRVVTGRFGVLSGYYAARVDGPRDGPKRVSPDDLVARAANPEDTKILENLDLKRAISNALQVGESYSGRLIIDEKKYYYKTVPVLFVDWGGEEYVVAQEDVVLTKGRGPTTRRRLGALVILDEQPIDVLCHAFASVLVDEYVGATNHATKMRALQMLAEVRANAQLQLLAQPFNTSSDVDREIRSFSNSVCRALVQITAAHSATVRLLDPFSASLHPVGQAFSDTLSPDSSTAADIRIDPADDSLNAFVFRKLSPRECAYIPDTQAPIPEELTARGLRTIRVRRKETRSELCVPLYKTGLCIGVLNIEAAVENAFWLDVRFILGLVDQLGEFIDLVTRSSDAGWLPRLSFIHFAAHRIEQLKRDLGGDPKTLAKVMAAHTRTSPDYVDPREMDFVKFDSIISNAQSYIVELRQGGRDKLHQFTVEGQFPERLPRRIAHSLELILENLIENASKHDDLRSPISVVGEPLGVNSTKMVLRYRSKGAALFPPELSRVGIAPQRDMQDESFHLGMFLVGVHVRLLGGMMWVFRGGSAATEASPFCYEIHIPVAGNAVGEETNDG